jgi:hypothetical protein
VAAYMHRMVQSPPFVPDVRSTRTVVAIERVSDMGDDFT